MSHRNIYLNSAARTSKHNGKSGAFGSQINLLGSQHEFRSCDKTMNRLMASTHDAKLVSESVATTKQRANARVRSYDISSNKFTEVEQQIDMPKSKKTSPHRLAVEQPAFITNPIAECSKLSVALSSTADQHELMSQRDLSTYLTTQMSNYEREKWVCLF